MARAQALHFHPFPLRQWMHVHPAFVRTSSWLVIALLAGAIAVPVAAMIRDAIDDADRVVAASAREAAPATLPREWVWSTEPIRFDHMYREGRATTPIESMIMRPRSQQ